MSLQPVHFIAVESGIKVIESRIFDDKRQRIKLGDRIHFKNAAERDRVVVAEVLGLLRYATFSAMFSDISVSLFGESSSKILEEQLYGFYSKDEEAEYGVVGIRFSRLPSPVGSIPR